MGPGPSRLQELTYGNYGDDDHNGACPFLLKLTKFTSTYRGPTGWFSVLAVIAGMASHDPASVGGMCPFAESHGPRVSVDSWSRDLAQVKPAWRPCQVGLSRGSGVSLRRIPFKIMEVSA